MKIVGILFAVILVLVTIGVILADFPPIVASNDNENNSGTFGGGYTFSSVFFVGQTFTVDTTTTISAISMPTRRALTGSYGTVRAAILTTDGVRPTNTVLATSTKDFGPTWPTGSIARNFRCDKLTNLGQQFWPLNHVLVLSANTTYAIALQKQTDFTNNLDWEAGATDSDTDFYTDGQMFQYDPFLEGDNWTPQDVDMLFCVYGVGGNLADLRSPAQKYVEASGFASPLGHGLFMTGITILLIFACIKLHTPPLVIAALVGAAIVGFVGWEFISKPVFLGIVAVILLLGVLYVVSRVGGNED